jgi:choline-glycine betaine transporter
MSRLFPILSGFNHPLSPVQPARLQKTEYQCRLLVSVFIGDWHVCFISRRHSDFMAGLNHLFSAPKTMWTLGLITFSIVITLVGAAASGVLKGVRVLADWNVKLFALIILYVLFLSFVTAADANTVAMADISSYAEEQSKEKKRLKIIWGLVLGSISFLTVSYTGVEGIKMLSNCSGIPALLLLILVLISLLKLNFNMGRRGMIQEVWPIG